MARKCIDSHFYIAGGNKNEQKGTEHKEFLG